MLQRVDGKAVCRGQRGGIVEAEIIRNPDHSLRRFRHRRCKSPVAQEDHPITGLQVLHLGSNAANNTCSLLTEVWAACVDAAGSNPYILIGTVSMSYFGEGVQVVSYSRV